MAIRRIPPAAVAGYAAAPRPPVTTMFRAALLVFLLLLTAACADGKPDAAEDMQALPPEVASLAERSAMCTHFAGEFNGDGSAHDREVNQTMTELRCGSVEEDVAAARRKYANNPAVLQALDQAEAP